MSRTDPHAQERAAMRREVNRLYDTFGFKSREYQEAFNKLHYMNMAWMAEGYREERGLSPNAITPYDSPNTTEEDLKVFRQSRSASPAGDMVREHL